MKNVNKKRGAVLLVFAGLVFLPAFMSAQENIFGAELEELMRAGVEYHDEGDFDKAIECYQKALKIASNNPAVYYEIGFSYLYKEEPQAALDYVQKGIDLALKQGSTGELPGLYDLKGSALDDLGRREEAVQVYLEAISRFNSNNTRLYYNLGLTYYRMGERDKAWIAIAQSLAEDTFHPSSNLLLGKICFELGRKTQSLYSLCYFLLLEPNSSRSEEAYETIQQIMLDKENNSEDGIYVSDTGGFTGADLILGLMLASPPAEESPGKQLIERLSVFFSLMEDQTPSGGGNPGSAEDLWWEFYIPFFSGLAKSEHFETYCHYIGMNSSSESRDWLDENNEKIDALFVWLNEED